MQYHLKPFEPRYSVAFFMEQADRVGVDREGHEYYVKRREERSA